jgi:PAS domain S-box-containing protein
VVKVLGTTPETIVGQSLLEMGHPDDKDLIGKAFAELIQNPGATKTLVHRMKHQDGTWHTLQAIGRMIRDDSGSPVILANSRDVSEEKALESRLNQAQKLEAVGQLAAGIAHEINTPTQYVGDNTRFLQESFRDLNEVLAKYGRLLEAVKSAEDGLQAVREVEEIIRKVDLTYLAGEIPRAFNETLEGVERVTKIVRAMKEFSHPGTTEKALADINKALENTITVSRNEWKYVAEMVIDLDSSLPPVPCLLGEFNQAILNLIINAAHAIADVVGDAAKGKGTIRVSTRHKDGWAEVRISDTGSGIPENIRSRIFNPFFTTKKVGKGTGQGLAIAHNVIVKKQGGTIDFESEVGKGTTFIIRLPLVDGATAQ